MIWEECIRKQKVSIVLVGETPKQKTNRVRIPQSAKLPAENVIEAEAVCGLVIPASELVPCG